MIFFKSDIIFKDSITTIYERFVHKKRNFSTHYFYFKIDPLEIYNVTQEYYFDEELIVPKLLDARF